MQNEKPAAQPDAQDLLDQHAARRRAFLARTAKSAPAVALLLEAGMKPAFAAPYAGGPGETTQPQPTTGPTTAFETTATDGTTAPPATTTTATTTTPTATTTEATTGE